MYLEEEVVLRKINMIGNDQEKKEETKSIGLNWEKKVMI